MAKRRLGWLRNPSVALSVGPDGALPTEFPIFQPGPNATQFGTYFLDASDLASVMECFESEGVDIMVDLEHDSIDEEKRAVRPDAADARGWVVPYATPEGGLSARVLNWCPDGARRLRERTQRYISPVFEYDADDGHIKRLVNVALVARPATHHAAPLVAARKREVKRMNPELLKKLLDALTAGDSAAALELLKEVIAAEASEPGEGAPGEATNALAENAAPPTPPTPPAADAAAKDDKEMANALRQVTCRQSAGEAIAVLRQMAADVKTLMGERARVDMGSRVELIGDLVKLGAETPATAWDGDPDKMLPVARLRSESVDSLRNRIAILRQGRENEAPIERPTVALSADDQRRADSIKDPVHKERFIARRLGRA
jgi:phage I-like protein